MDKQKQILEMAKALCANCRKDGYSCSLYSSDDDWVCVQERERAEFFYNAGYRKIHENEVVLTRGEYNEYEKCKDLLTQYVNGEIVNEDVFSQQVDDIKKVRKETAEKFAERLKENYPLKEEYSHLHFVIDEICKEITEGE